jgi:hypothetical protein
MADSSSIDNDYLIYILIRLQNKYEYNKVMFKLIKLTL